jgi:phenylalanyl-tRNA synthetase beta chain
MKFPYSMLLDFVETSLTAEEAGDLLTMAGFELEGIEEEGGESVLDVKVMSNRGDGLSMLGLAREVLAKDLTASPTPLYLRAASRFENAPAGAFANEALVQIETPDCTRYACRMFRNVPVQQSPDWLGNRLRLAGQRSISLVVDLTNYVMLELGQPLHAFDFDTLEGGRIVVRTARDGETLKTLDGGSHELRGDQMMICDACKPVGAAGIMGGESTEVSTTTVNILLESAHFDSRSVRRTRKQLGLSTEASYRFERSVDPDGVLAAIERFSELLGIAGSEIVDVYPGRRSRSPVTLKIDRAEVLLGMPIPEEEARVYLTRLGMEVSGNNGELVVVPASWRPDVVREEDLIEELGRVHGYDKIPEILPTGLTTLGIAGAVYAQIDRLREGIIRHGYTQVINHSLRDSHRLDRVGARIGPRTPSSPEYSILRNSLLPSLAEVLQRNGARNLHLFEIGNVFEGSEQAPEESRSLAFISTGELMPSARKGEVVPMASFFSLKGDLVDALGDIGRAVEFAEPHEIDPRFHPGRQAVLWVGGWKVGILAQLHPEIAEELRLEHETYVAEIDLDALLATSQSPFSVKPISKNPAVRRDIALLIDRAVPFGRIESVVKETAANLLESVTLFDDFAGEGIPAGKHSLGIALQLRKQGQNFTDQEANLVRDQVVAALAELGGSAR